jgi:ligand-binding SRPBCC domain-containing protein
LNRRLLPSFSIEIRRTGLLTYRLFSVQVLPVGQAEAFTFFEDPRNLFGITPPWLDFRMKDPARAEVFENAEFDYTIRWLGFRMRWRSRIKDYVPPERFTDIQIIGPYRFWTHRHSLSAVAEGTLMEDEVLYCLPLYAAVFSPIISRQLRDIFIYRAVRIEEWTAGRAGMP